MAALTAEQVYEQHVKPLPTAQRLRLVALTAEDLSRQSVEHSDRARQSIMELHGLGREIWKGMDAQEYVNELRKEWDHRP